MLKQKQEEKEIIMQGRVIDFVILRKWGSNLFCTEKNCFFQEALRSNDFKRDRNTIRVTSLLYRIGF